MLPRFLQEPQAKPILASPLGFETRRVLEPEALGDALERKGQRSDARGENTSEPRKPKASGASNLL